MGRWQEAQELSRDKIAAQLQDCLKHMRGNRALQPESAVIIDGKALVHALHKDLAPRFLAIARMCCAVLCCRVSPKQKAQVRTAAAVL